MYTVTVSCRIESEDGTFAYTPSVKYEGVKTLEQAELIRKTLEEALESLKKHSARK